MSNVIVFLDIDGVLNSKSFFNTSRVSDSGLVPDGNPPHLVMDTEAVDVLRKWVEKNDAKIVISSSWRDNEMNAGGWNDANKSNFFIANAMKWCGWVNVENYLIGNTGYLWSKRRGVEIDDWIYKNSEYCKENTVYIILDDMPGFSDIQKKEWLVKINGEAGLKEKDCQRMDGKMLRQSLKSNNNKKDWGVNYGKV
jgi:HAD domain in Swiss Army Knife RNA repair proteins